MEYVALGKTGLKVSVAGLGAGGHSRLGMRTNQSEQTAAGVVARALELGINLIDTAEIYGTEAIVGAGIRSAPRADVVLSTKFSLYEDRILRRPEQLEASLDRSLSKLKTEYIDIYHLHAVELADYRYATEHLVPEMDKMRDKGKIRFFGITEMFGKDPAHEMAKLAVQDDCWDVMMVGFHMLNQSARDMVLAAAVERNIGILCMFAVRKALSDPQTLAALIADLVGRGLLDGREIDPDRPLDFLIKPDGAGSVVEAAYRYCRHEPGIHVTLTGTGNVRHLQDNVASINGSPLPDELMRRLRELFGHLDSVTGN